MKLYIAYGSNMDMDQMAYRCPDAAYVGTAALEGWRLMFKGSKSGNYATIEREEGCKVPVLLWEVTAEDEKSLDRYEAYPNFYYKDYLDVPGFGKAMVYIMHEERLLGAPSDIYFDVLYKAYGLFKFDIRILMEALEYSRDHAGKSKINPGRRKLALDKRRLKRGIYCTKEEHLWLMDILEKRRQSLGLRGKIRRVSQKNI